MSARRVLAAGAVTCVLLAGCSLPPVDLHAGAPAADAPSITVDDKRALPDPSSLGAQLITTVGASTRPVPDLIHDAVAASLARHAIPANAAQLAIQVGRFGIDVTSQGSGELAAQADWGVFVANSNGAPRCAVAVRVAVPVEGSQRAAALQAALDQAADQAAAAATCQQGAGL